MRAIQTGNIFRIHDNSMKTYDALPAGSYLVNFSQREGFYLSIYQDIKINERIYGVHEEKVDLVLHSFERFERNLGVILSGDRGIGKSLFAKLLAVKAMKQGFPLIVVNTYYPGIAEYLTQIEQEVMVLFDEFDKVFPDKNVNGFSAQTEMLTLFDGISQGKKLFVITCNETGKLNDYLTNRPGRFHYHFRFDYPRDEEIERYLRDNVDPVYANEIKNVINFSHKVNLNFDCLRAIAFELNLGRKFKDAIKDLNIIYSGHNFYSVTVHLSNGEIYTKNYRLDMFSSKNEIIFFNDKEGEELFIISFNPDNVEYSSEFKCQILRGENCNFALDKYYTSRASLSGKDYDPEVAAVIDKYKDVTVSLITFEINGTKNMHYLV